MADNLLRYIEDGLSALTSGLSARDLPWVIVLAVGVPIVAAVAIAIARAWLQRT